MMEHTEKEVRQNLLYLPVQPGQCRPECKRQAKQRHDNTTTLASVKRPLKIFAVF